MKLQNSRFLLAASIMNALAVTAFAGPGLQYWQSRATQIAPEPAKVAMGHFTCPGSKEIPVMAKVAAWPNGKGPLVDKQIEAKRVCTLCAGGEVASSNGKASATKAGVVHDCTPACAANKS